MSRPASVTAEQAVFCENPATGEVLGESKIDSPEQAREAIRRAREAQRQWRDTPLAERVRRVLRIRDHLVDNADDIATVIAADVGKTRIDALATDVMPAAMATSCHARNARRFMRPIRLRGGSVAFANKRSTIHRVPYGVIGIISPWNYPLGIPIHEIVPALLAGNGVVFKTAPETQMVGRRIEEIVAAGDLPAGLFAHLNMPGSTAGDVFLEAGGVDKLFFTGSVRVGKLLMARAAETLTPVALELGGNDAMLVCADADLGRSVNGAIWAGLQNSGQTCAGVERIYVHEEVYDGFMALLKSKVEQLRVGADRAHDVDIGAMCTARQTASVTAQIEDALSRGARVFARSEAPAESAAGNFLPVTVLVDVNHDMAVMREETFGPVLGVMKVNDMDEAIALANDSLLGLTGSVWSRDTRMARALGRRMHAGVITINDHLISHGLAELNRHQHISFAVDRRHDAGLIDQGNDRFLDLDLVKGQGQGQGFDLAFVIGRDQFLFFFVEISNDAGEVKQPVIHPDHSDLGFIQ